MLVLHITKQNVKILFFLNVILIYLLKKSQNQQREANKKYKPIKYNHMEKK